MTPYDLNDALRQEGLIHAARLTGRREADSVWPAALHFLRRLFIGLVIAVCLVYCWASVAYQNQVDVPGYRLVRVDPLGGRTRAQWDADEEGRFQRLMALENKRYQLPPDATLRLGGKVVRSDNLLTADDFAAHIAQTPAGLAADLDLRDPAAIYDLADRGYVLRDAIYDPARPGDEPLIDSAEPVDKRLVDELHGMGVKVISVAGHGQAVGFEFGTAVMLALIFLGLVAALKPILWDPFRVLLDKRGKELEMGAEAARANQTEAAKLAAERASREAELARAIQGRRMRRQQETAKKAGDVVDRARGDEKAARRRGMQETLAASAGAGEALRAEIPELAESIVDAVLGRGADAGGK